MKVTYNLDIYSQDIIKAAIDVYREYANISASYEESGSCVLVFSNFTYDMRETINEFNNYLIELLNGSN